MNATSDNSATAKIDIPYNDDDITAEENGDEEDSFFDIPSTADPSEWTHQQQLTIGLAIGATAIAILIVMLCSYYRHTKKESRGAHGLRIYTPGEATYILQIPAVRRTSVLAAAVDGQDNLPLGATLHGADKLHRAKLDGANVRVAVIDSGIDKDHPGFDGMVTKQQWYRDGRPLLEDDHGTHVAGTIHFMAPKAVLHDYRVFGKTGIDGDEAIAKSIRQAVEDGCRIINMSLNISIPIVPAVESAVKFAAKKGIVMVCAAGNKGDGDPLTNEMNTYPARWKQTISVAAVKKSNLLPVATFSESNAEVDFAGIGVDVTSLKPGGGYQTMQGTSMATPHVTGLIAALMTNGGYKSNVNKLKKDLVSKYSIDIAAEGKDNSTGVGFVTFLTKAEFDDAMKNMV